MIILSSHGNFTEVGTFDYRTTYLLVLFLQDSSIQSYFTCVLVFNPSGDYNLHSHILKALYAFAIRVQIGFLFLVKDIDGLQADVVQ